MQQKPFTDSEMEDFLEGWKIVHQCEELDDVFIEYQKKGDTTKGFNIFRENPENAKKPTPLASMTMSAAMGYALIGAHRSGDSMALIYGYVERSRLGCTPRYARYGHWLEKHGVEHLIYRTIDDVESVIANLGDVKMHEAWKYGAYACALDNLGNLWICPEARGDYSLGTFYNSSWLDFTPDKLPEMIKKERERRRPAGIPTKRPCACNAAPALLIAGCNGIHPGGMDDMDVLMCEGCGKMWIGDKDG